MNATPPVDTVVLDVDGTLVDSVYEHTIAWAAAFVEAGVVVPQWRIHRAIGMGGDRLVGEVAGEEVDRDLGDQVRAGHEERFESVLDRIRPLPGAADLLEELRRRGLKVVLASSGKPEHTERLLDVVGARERTHGWTTSGDVSHSKPAPDLVDAAINRVGGRTAVMVGDAVWDIHAATDYGRPSVGLLCGGFSEAELEGAGAEAVFSSPLELLEHLEETSIGRGWSTR